MDVLVIDVGGTHVKLLATGQDEPVKFVSGPKLTPDFTRPLTQLPHLQTRRTMKPLSWKNG